VLVDGHSGKHSLQACPVEAAALHAGHMLGMFLAFKTMAAVIKVCPVLLSFLMMAGAPWVFRYNMLLVKS